MSEDRYERYLRNKNIIDLRDAIIKQACKDYVKTGMYMLRRPDEISKPRFVHEDITKWFLSRRFDKLETSHSGEWFLRQLDMQIDYLWTKKIKDALDFTRAKEIEKYGEYEYKRIRHKYRYRLKEFDE